MCANARWIPEYKLENEYIKPKKNKIWDYNYEGNKLPWSSRYLINSLEAQDI